MKSNNYLKLYAITNQSINDLDKFYKDIEKALKAGITCLQLRLKQIDVTQFEEIAICVKKLCDRYNVPLIINDQVEIAAKINSFGVHLGQDDFNVLEARKLLNKKQKIGLSVQNEQQAILANNCNVDYIGVGAMFTTDSKNDAKKVSFDELKKIEKISKLPIVVIGGINLGNIHNFHGHNIDGFAIISDIFNRNDIEAHTINILEKINFLLKE
ncbi:MAG: thiamine phosphate synthase [Mycoplasma sp.]